MTFTLKISWVKVFLVMVATGINGYFVLRLRAAEKKYEAGIEHIRYIQGEQFLLEMKFQRTSDSYTQSWSLQNKTAEMMFTMGQDICDKRRGLLKKLSNVAHQIGSGEKPKPNPLRPWE